MTYAIIVIKQVRLFVLGVMEQGGKVSLQIQVISMEEETLLYFMKIPLLEILLAIQTFTLNVILVEGQGCVLAVMEVREHGKILDITQVQIQKVG